MSLDNQIILIMGAGGRLGQSMVSATISQGAAVVAVDSNIESLMMLKDKYQHLKHIHFFNGDITNASVIQNIFSKTEQIFGKINGAVSTAYPHNANYGRPFLNVTYKDFSENISLHLGGYFVFMQQCIKYALDKDVSFSLVNLSSIYGSIAPRFDLYEDTLMTMPVEYAAIKAGLNHLVKYATAYTKGTKFRVNCVSPGGIFANQDDRFLTKYKKYCRDKGMLDPNDVVGTVLFLLSDDSTYICGQNIIIDDGFHV